MSASGTLSGALLAVSDTPEEPTVSNLYRSPLSYPVSFEREYHAQQARPPSPHSAAAAALRRASASPPPSPRQSLSLAGASYTGSSNRRVSPLRDQQPSTPGVSLWNTSWQRSLRAESPSSDNASPSVSGTAWIPFQPSQTVTRDEQDSSNSSKPEANLPKATGSSHRSRRVPREILTAETNAVLEAEFRMMAHARHFVTAEADALHKEILQLHSVQTLLGHPGIVQSFFGMRHNNKEVRASCPVGSVKFKMVLHTHASMFKIRTGYLVTLRQMVRDLHAILVSLDHMGEQ